MENSKIQWTDHTFNPWVGCSKVSAGCLNCYAETLMAKRYGRVDWGPRGTRSRTSDAMWREPVRWNREAQRDQTRKLVFCCSLADVFEDWNGPITTSKRSVLWRDRAGEYADAEASGFEPYEMATLDHLRCDLFELIDETPNLDWLLLTKRPENIRAMWPQRSPLDYRENVWLGTSPCDQKTADESIPHLLDCRALAPILFLSAEPLIGPVDLRSYLPSLWQCNQRNAIDWVIVGGESGHGARPCDKSWVRDIVRQSQERHVPCFVKQLGANHPDAAGGQCLDDSHKGDDITRWPLELQVREFPEPQHA